MKAPYIVYLHINKKNRKRYYGITKMGLDTNGECKRWYKGKGYKDNKYFYRAIEKYSWDGFDHIIVAKGLTKEEAEWLEVELIKAWDTTNKEKGYNIRLGGSCSAHSKESKKKISESLKGRPAHNKGIPCSEEQKTKQSNKMKGKPSPMKGKTHSKESKKKISKNIVETYGKPVICITTGLWFESTTEGAKYYNISCINNISMCCKGFRKSAGKLNGEKLVWKYAD